MEQNYQETMQYTPYFQSLPEHIRQSVKHCGAQFENENDLRKFVENLANGSAF